MANFFFQTHICIGLPHNDIGIGPPKINIGRALVEIYEFVPFGAEDQTASFFLL